MNMIPTPGANVHGLDGRTVHFVQHIEQADTSGVRWMVRHYCGVKAWFDLEKQDPVLRIPVERENYCKGCLSASEVAQKR
jgi:hypothetical protein